MSSAFSRALGFFNEQRKRLCCLKFIFLFVCVWSFSMRASCTQATVPNSFSITENSVKGVEKGVTHTTGYTVASAPKHVNLA